MTETNEDRGPMVVSDDSAFRGRRAGRGGAAVMANDHRDQAERLRSAMQEDHRRSVEQDERDLAQVQQRATRELETALKRKPTADEIGFVLRAALHPPGTPKPMDLRRIKVKDLKATAREYSKLIATAVRED